MSFFTFRIDDVTPGMRRSSFDRLRSIFQQIGIKPLIGVVPKNEDPKLSIDPESGAFWEDVLDLKERGWQIAQHGFRHVYDTKCGGILNLNSQSEFAGLDYNTQLARVKSGMEILASKNLASNVWMAPSHSYDLTTLQVLFELGFKYVSDGYTPYPYRYCGLTFLPCQIASPRFLPFGTFTVCLHPNTMMDNDFIKLELFVNKYRLHIHNYDELYDYPVSSITGFGAEGIILLARRVLKRLV